MGSYWSGYRMGLILADLFAAAVAMLVVGSIGILLGPLAASVAVGGLLAVSFMRQARTMAEGGPLNTMIKAACVTILDAAGKQRVRIDGAGIHLSDDAGRTRMVMGVDANGPDLQICDQNGNLQVSLGSRPDGNSGLALMDEAGKVRAQAVIRKELGGIASFGLYDSTGRVRGNFFISDRLTSLNFTDDQGVIIWRAPSV
jgi:hypothetical protein